METLGERISYALAQPYPDMSPDAIRARVCHTVNDIPRATTIGYVAHRFHYCPHHVVAMPTDNNFMSDCNDNNHPPEYWGDNGAWQYETVIANLTRLLCVH